MKRNHLEIRVRFWLTLAVAIASLGFTSSAFAMNASDAAGPSATPQAPVVATPDGFNWSDAAVGAGAALGVALCCIALAYLARSRTRLAT